jgi:hypothetical protein
MDIKEPAVYVATCAFVPWSLQRTYITFLQEHALPLWLLLKQEGLLASRSTLELVMVRAETRAWPIWNYVHLTRIPDGGDAQVYLQAEAERKKALWERVRGAEQVEKTLCEVRRVEILASTPGYYHPLPTAEGQQRAGEVYQATWYVDVQTPYLQEYRDLMTTVFGPASKATSAAGWNYNFLALETTAVEFTQQGMPAWNQIHTGGYFGSLSWKQLEVELMSLAAKPEHQQLGSAFARLEQIRTIPREEISREVRSLHIPE